MARPNPVTAAVRDRSINSMFNEMLGEGAVPPHIALEKYTKLRAAIEPALTLLENFCRGGFFKTYAAYERAGAEILVFCRRAREELAARMPPAPFSEAQTIIPGQIAEAAAVAFTATYKAAKEMEVVRVLIMTCNRLIAYRGALTRGAADPKFVDAVPGPSFAPFPFAPALNLKEAFVRPDMTEQYRAYIMTLLAMVFGRATSGGHV